MDAHEQASLEDEITLLKLQNHHLNARLIDHVKIEAARTDQIASVAEENEVLREELASLVEALETYETAESQDTVPQLPAAFSDGLPVRRTPSPGPSKLRTKRSVTSLGQRPGVRAFSTTPQLQSRPQTSQGYTAPLRVRSASPSVRYHPPEPPFSSSPVTTLSHIRGDSPPPPPTPTLNLLPPTPAPKRAPTLTDPVPPFPLNLGSVLASLSDRSLSPELKLKTFGQEHPSTLEPRPISRASLGNPFSFTLQTLQRCPEPELAPDRGSEDHLQGLLSELSDEGSGREKGDSQDMVDHGRSLSFISDSPRRSDSPNYDTDSDATSEADSASEVESLVAPQPLSNRSSMYSHSKRDSNLPEPTDMIFHLTQMMRLERKEREEERARWEEERRDLLAKAADMASTPSHCECVQIDLQRDQTKNSGWDESCALPPAYDFLKPWTYPLPYSNMIHDMDQRLDKLLHEVQELAQEKRLFETLARASGDDCIDND